MIKRVLYFSVRPDGSQKASKTQMWQKLFPDRIWFPSVAGWSWNDCFTIAKKGDFGWYKNWKQSHYVSERKGSLTLIVNNLCTHQLFYILIIMPSVFFSVWPYGLQKASKAQMWQEFIPERIWLTSVAGWSWNDCSTIAKTRWIFITKLEIGVF